MSYIYQGSLIILFFISTVLSLNPGNSYYYLWGFITIFLIVNLANTYITDLPQFFSVILLISLIYSIILIATKTGLVQIPIKGLGDNFILQVWGHSYLGNFLLIPIAACFNRINLKNFKKYSLLLIIFGISLLLSQSRSGIIGAIVTLLFTQSTSTFQVNLKKILIFVFTITLTIIAIFSSKSIAQNKSADGSRPIFWRQAISGIYQSPLLGNGPATFSLINRQFKKPDEAITNTSHNSILELITNNGIIFSAIFLTYIFWGLKYRYKSQPLLFGIGVGLFASSLLDSFLSFPGFFTIFMIFITYRNPSFYNNDPKNLFPSKIYLGITSLLIFIFFLLKTSSDIAYYKQNYPLSIQLDPFNINSLLELKDPESIRNMLNIFPSEEVAILSAIKYTPLPESIPYYQKLFQVNPQINPHYYSQLGQYYFESNNYSEVSKLLSKFDSQFSAKSEILPQHNIARLYYHLSIHNWKNNRPQEAIENIIKSIYYSVGWSHFHIELANMYWHSNQKTFAINQLQKKCHDYSPSALACDKYLNENMNDFLKPGTPEFIKGINEIGK